MISFLMMAKNEEKYIAEAINELQKEKDIQWELIVIDDNSSDNTYKIVEEISKLDNRVTIESNPHSGKVDGTSYAYSLSKGDILKCIDSDDILLSDWFGSLDKMYKYDAHCHSALIVDEDLREIAKYNPNPKLISSTYEEVASDLLSLPKWSWSFKRSIAEKVFPLPSDLPFEDVWMAILIKKHAENILLISKPLYLYRQHDSQTFGGIINFDRVNIQFRAKRLLKLISVLRENPRVLRNSNLDYYSFDNGYKANLYLANEQVRLLPLIKLNISVHKKLKMVFYLFMPKITQSLIQFKWWLDAKKS